VNDTDGRISGCYICHTSNKMTICPLVSVKYPHTKFHLDPFSSYPLDVCPTKTHCEAERCGFATSLWRLQQKLAKPSERSQYHFLRGRYAYWHNAHANAYVSMWVLDYNVSTNRVI